jgi:hypothetical protein
MPARMEEEQRQIEQDQARVDKEAARMRAAREEN